jgi:hypothetical protein
LDFSWAQLIDEAYEVGTMSAMFTIEWLADQRLNVYNRVIAKGREIRSENASQ